MCEIFNEPEKDETWPQVKDYANAVIGAIRQHDADNLVIVGCPEWDQRIDLVAADPLQGQSNVMYYSFGLSAELAVGSRWVSAWARREAAGGQTLVCAGSGRAAG
jgi:hypothetical protein